MNVDICICTWNRAALLEQTLQSLAHLHVPVSCHLRVVIVDNGSEDNTPVIIRSFESLFDGRGFETVVLEEPQQGHTFARNRAVQHVTGELVLWTDDDVIVDPHWLDSYLEASTDSSCDFWGGKIEPRFQPSRPAWIAENWENVKGCFAARDLGNDPLPLDEQRLPYGANFAIRGDVQKQFNFDTELGRRGDEVLGEDELDLFRRLLRSGHRGCWTPAAKVQHIVPAMRASEIYVRDYFIGQGRALFQRGEAWSASTAKLKRMMIWEHLMYRFKRQWAASPAWVSHLIRSGLAAGQWQESRKSLD